MFLLLSLGRYLSAAGLSVVYGYGQNNICGGATGRGPVQKYVLCMCNRKLRNIRPSGAFWPEVTSPEAALTESMFCACPVFSRALFLVVVQNVDWGCSLRRLRPITIGNWAFWPEVTSVMWWRLLEEVLSGSMFCACTTGSCAISTLVGPFDWKWHQF